MLFCNPAERTKAVRAVSVSALILDVGGTSGGSPGPQADVHPMLAATASTLLPREEKKHGEYVPDPLYERTWRR